MWGLVGLSDDPFSRVIKADQSGKSVLYGALGLYGAGQDRRGRELIALLQSRKVFGTAFDEVVKEHFGITDLNPK
jgi:hypothetical protein